MQSGVYRIVSLVDVLHLDLQLLPLVLEKRMDQRTLSCYSLARVTAQHLLEQVTASRAETLEEIRVEVDIALAVLLYDFFDFLALEERLLEESK